MLSLFLFYLNIGPLHQSGTGDNELPFRAAILKLAYLIVSLAFSCTDAISVQMVYLYTHILGFMGISYHLFSFFFFSKFIRDAWCLVLFWYLVVVFFLWLNNFSDTFIVFQESPLFLFFIFYRSFFSEQSVWYSLCIVSSWIQWHHSYSQAIQTEERILVFSQWLI